MNRSYALCVIGCVSAVLLSAGCKTATEVAVDPLNNTEWKLKSYISVSGTMDPVVHMSQTSMKIADGTVSGNAGANDYTGSIEIEGSEVEFSATGSTMMMGTPELMAQEGQFLKLLGEAEAYQIEGEELRLLDDDGKTVLVFVPSK